MACEQMSLLWLIDHLDLSPSEEFSASEVTT